tara:strand:- start:470 stop:1390 length:921 start_codon:yes stop_codon:yes gene_type:complete
MSDAETRLHFRIGYLGDAFHGSQIQPDVRTVQGELIHAFKKLGWLSEDEEGHNLVLSSRTDAGVHVRLNGGTVRVASSLWDSITPRKFVRAVDDLLPEEIAFLDVRAVDMNWNPRMAVHRVYRYRLEGIEFWNDPGEEFSEWLKLFEGTYNAQNFARLEPGKNPIRTIKSCTPWVVDGRTVGFEIVGEAFLWNQVRRTAMALQLLALGELSPDDVRNAIENPEVNVDFGVAPPDWLILWGVEWADSPIPMSKESNCRFSPPPIPSREAERTMRKRWRQGARMEMKTLLQLEWMQLGELPIAYHKSN